MLPLIGREESHFRGDLKKRKLVLIKKANCMFCHNNYGMLVDVENGKIIKVRANPDHKISQGKM